MRGKLGKLEGQRLRFSATFERYGYKKRGFEPIYERTILLKNLRIEGSNKILCDHIWITDVKETSNVNWQPGVRVGFDARVRRYAKIYCQQAFEDFCVSYPRNFEIEKQDIKSKSKPEIIRLCS